MNATSGYRNGSAVVVLITDSTSHEDPSFIDDVATRLHQVVSEVHVVGVGESVSMSQLELFASSPSYQYVNTLSLQEFSGMIGTNSIATSIACGVTSTTSVTTTTTSTSTITLVTCPSFQRAVDLIIVLDSSSSWGDLGWYYVTRFAASIIGRFPISDSKSQFEVTEFAVS